MSPASCARRSGGCRGSPCGERSRRAAPRPTGIAPMSLTTVAAPSSPMRRCSISRLRVRNAFSARIHRRRPGFFHHLGVYIATLAPNVTLEDSGELITAAAKFGVATRPATPSDDVGFFFPTSCRSRPGLADQPALRAFRSGVERGADAPGLPFGTLAFATVDDPEHQAAVRPYVFLQRAPRRPRHWFSDVMWTRRSSRPSMARSTRFS